MSKNKSLILIIFIALVVRLLFINLPGLQSDVNSWFAWSERLTQIPLSSFYSDRVFSDYLPGYLYILEILGFLKTTFLIQNDSFFLILKLPSIFAELGIGILIYLILKQVGLKKFALAGSLFFLLNPAIIFNSAIWGQIDGVLTIFLLLSLYLLEKGYLSLSSILFSISFLVKPQAISITPIFFLYLIRKFSVINLIKISLPGFITLIILSFPFFPNNPISGLFQKVIQTASEYPYTSLNAYNLWGIVGFWISDTKTWNNLTYQTWGYILLSLYWLIIAYFYLKGKLSIYSLATLATLSFFFLPTKVHERYLYPALVFLIIISFQLRSKVLIALTATLSLLHLANLYYVYILYNKFQLNYSNTLYSKSSYDFLESQPYLLSMLSSILFILISIIIIKLNYENKNSD